VNYIEEDYPNRISESKEIKQFIDKTLTKNQHKFEESVLKVLKAYPNDGIRLLTEYTNRNITELIHKTKLQLKKTN
jgi:hypothetical protein